MSRPVTTTIAGGLLALGVAITAGCRPGGPRAHPTAPPADTGRPGGPTDLPAGTWTRHDLVYAPVSRAQRLDLYRPSPPPFPGGADDSASSTEAGGTTEAGGIARTGGTGRATGSARAAAGALPVVLTIHGGAFAVGDKRDDLPVVRALVRAGYAVASVNYRLSGEARFPAAVQDVKAAVRWLRAHADEYGLDPDRIAASGASAGAYLALMLGATAGVPMYDDPALGHPGVSSDVRAVVDFFGPVNFASMDDQARANVHCSAGDAGHGRRGSPESRFLGRTVATAPQLVRVASPLHYLGRGPLPPFLLEHGDADCTVPHGQTLELADALRAAGAPVVEATIVAGAGHGPDFPTADRMPTVLAFLARALDR
ncbi:Esterase/lipase [Frankia canadensis]|uniref:Esterase/lipase n=1 Tax=Frankia canadensis TaxID=1836972 RepID=A0A2I2L1Y0_9ACTN|nr:alpha/beta hydrolase [Frankia canadensis]SNQ51922.1 Esterase/lipase [Frankia canadensis]SOU59212.1 Esterase/lipase [Frankia canadensis]